MYLLYPTTSVRDLERVTSMPFKSEIRGCIIRDGRIEPEWSSTSARRAKARLYHNELRRVGAFL